MKRFAMFILLSLSLIFLTNCSSKKQDMPLKEVTIVVKSNNNLVVENEIVPLEELPNKLNSFGDTSRLKVKIRPEKDVEMRMIQDVQTAIRKAGITKITFNGRLN